MTENVGSFNLHIAGLQEVIRRRGSLLMLQQNSLLRLVIFWYVSDKCGWLDGLMYPGPT